MAMPSAVKAHVALVPPFSNQGVTQSWLATKTSSAHAPIGSKRAKKKNSFFIISLYSCLAAKICNNYKKGPSPLSPFASPFSPFASSA
jgi:hypothetical protein